MDVPWIGCKGMEGKYFTSSIIKKTFEFVCVSLSYSLYIGFYFNLHTIVYVFTAVAACWSLPSRENAAGWLKFQVWRESFAINRYDIVARANGLRWPNWLLLVWFSSFLFILFLLAFFLFFWACPLKIKRSIIDRWRHTHKRTIPPLFTSTTTTRQRKKKTWLQEELCISSLAKKWIHFLHLDENRK